MLLNQNHALRNKTLDLSQKAEKRSTSLMGATFQCLIVECFCR